MRVARFCCFLEGIFMSGRKLHFTLFAACWVFFLGCSAAAAQEQAVVERDVPLLAAPQSGAAVVTQLKVGTSAEVLARKGPWVNLRTAGGTGWTNSFNVRFLGADASPGRPTPTVTAPARKGGITATIGIRGLDEEDFRNAHYDDAQMRLLDSYAASKQDGEAVAAASGLSAARVDYFDKK
jgi:hypothetical protein